jgi:hypothetical protein
MVNLCLLRPLLLFLREKNEFAIRAAFLLKDM